MPTFSSFKNHLGLAHHYWNLIVQPGDVVIDATCGKGRDALILSKLALKKASGELHLWDIQQNAIETTQCLLTKELSPEQLQKVHFHLGCHSLLANELPPSSVALIVYNLGYLPGGDKSLTTQRSSTLASIQSSLPLIQPDGGISIMCYPGHEEGAKEENALLFFLKELPSQEWSCCHHQWINCSKAPSLFLLRRRSS